MFVQGRGHIAPFNQWHSVKRAEAFGIYNDHTGYTTECDLYMTIVNTAETINDIPLLDQFCTSQACNMRAKLSQALNKCAVENRQSEWTVRY